ncbi:hypothetical protein SLEP1_g57085 [Rubroshorea leprosula]|uniref:Uncharacterized protein n=1 Tax=Rubroshorea leprosula TaxID=152421 RepID=A0AAV5MK55_9ROSI|nr:hypothetical protein SLEP1_g57085 [Rubroshorea leprosula]
MKSLSSLFKYSSPTQDLKGDEEGINGEDCDVVREGFDYGQNGDGVADEIDGAKVRWGAAGGLEESGDEDFRRGDLLEVGRGEILEEDVVAEEVGKGGLRQAVGEVGGGSKIGVGDGKESEGIAVVKVCGDKSG